MKRILITGSAGFIGSVLRKKLQEKEYSVSGYDLKNAQDIRDRFSLHKMFARIKPDVVIHLAALAGVKDGEDYTDEYVTTNITGTKNVIDMCKKHGVEKIIFFSSSSVLGDTDSPKDENAPYNPMSVYGSSKVAGEALVKNSGIEYVIVRPFTVYGPKGRNDMVIYKWIDQILSGKPITVYGEGDTSRGYTHVEDLVHGVELILDRFSQCAGEVFNLGGAEEIKMSKLIDIFSEVLTEKERKSAVEYFPVPGYDIKRSVARIDKARGILGWEPVMKFEESLKRILRSEIL